MLKLLTRALDPHVPPAGASETFHAQPGDWLRVPFKVITPRSIMFFRIGNDDSCATHTDMRGRPSAEEPGAPPAFALGDDGAATLAAALQTVPVCRFTRLSLGNCDLTAVGLGLSSKPPK